jgi:hypothetical protein
MLDADSRPNFIELAEEFAKISGQLFYVVIFPLSQG